MNGTKVSDFCKMALKRVLVGSPNQQIKDPQINDAQYLLNELLDAYNADGDLIYTMQFQTFALNTGQQIYTFGPSANADFNTGNTPRPSIIEYAAFQTYTSLPATDIPLKILNAEEWAEIRNKGVTTGISNYIYMDGGWPLANVYLWGIPNGPANLVLTSWQPMNSALGLGDMFSMPFGYSKMINLELALALAPLYGKSGTPDVALMGRQLSAIKRKIAFLNFRPSELLYSPEAQGASCQGGVYMIQTDQVV
jgi:hypothetical protein